MHIKVVVSPDLCLVYAKADEWDLTSKKNFVAVYSEDVEYNYIICLHADNTIVEYILTDFLNLWCALV